MPFKCPSCSSPRSLGIVATIELPPDSHWDEISLQIVHCSKCDFTGLAIYEESRRGALDSEVVHHTGYHIQDKDLNVLERMIRRCPKPSNRRCDCSTHLELGGKDEYGRWNGLSGIRLGKTFEMVLG